MKSSKTLRVSRHAGAIHNGSNDSGGTLGKGRLLRITETALRP